MAHALAGFEFLLRIFDLKFLLSALCFFPFCFLISAFCFLAGRRLNWRARQMELAISPWFGKSPLRFFPARESRAGVAQW